MDTGLVGFPLQIGHPTRTADGETAKAVTLQIVDIGPVDSHMSVSNALASSTSIFHRFHFSLLSTDKAANLFCIALLYFVTPTFG